jgi:diguanylate cyclase
MLGVLRLFRSTRFIDAGFIVFGTAACVAVSIIVNYLLFFGENINPFRQSMISAILLPVIIGAPLLLSIVVSRRKAVQLQQQLNQAMSVDSLTSTLNSVAFTTLVQDFGKRERRRERPGGTLVVVDADYLKSINERFGHEWGDEALRVIAHAIRSSVRSGDLVGRIGGKEFGVFLPGASLENAKDIAERIRRTVSEVVFEPNGKPLTLTVSGGAAVFQRPVAFDELIKVADMQLDAAKLKGRNRFEYGTVQPSLSASSAEPH